MRQQPYEHLLANQNSHPQGTLATEQQSFTKPAPSTAGIGSLSSILGNPANLAKFSTLFNMMKNNQRNSSQQQSTTNFTHNSSISDLSPQNSSKSLGSTQHINQENIYKESSLSPQSPLNSSMKNADNLQKYKQNSNESFAQNFPTINPQYSLEKLLQSQTLSSQTNKKDDQNELKNNRKSVLQQMSLHNAYLTRILHN